MMLKLLNSCSSNDAGDCSLCKFQELEIKKKSSFNRPSDITSVHLYHNDNE